MGDKANNIGIRHAIELGFSYFAILQDDDLPLAYDWLNKCVAFMIYSNISILGCRGVGHCYASPSPSSANISDQNHLRRESPQDFSIFKKRTVLFAYNVNLSNN